MQPPVIDPDESLIFAAPEPELEPVEEAFEELDDEFEEITLRIENQLLLGLVQSGQVSHYRGAVDVTRGQVVWTGDIVLRSYARGYY